MGMDTDDVELYDLPNWTQIPHSQPTQISPHNEALQNLRRRLFHHCNLICLRTC